jgi:hypothetical protein
MIKLHLINADILYHIYSTNGKKEYFAATVTSDKKSTAV